MTAKLAVWLPFLLLIAACQSVTTSEQPAVADASAGTQDKPSEKKAKSSADKLAEKQKELRKKQRALAHSKVDHQIKALERESAVMSNRAAIKSAQRDLEMAQAALELFEKGQKPRELEQQKIRYDRRMHSADHAKDELGELEAMYEADEFAKTTKELVLKRGRRQLEIATRELAVAKKEMDEFVDHTLPRREKELRAKIEKAEIALRKARMEADKLALQHKQAMVKQDEALSDLKEEIAKLEKELARQKS